MTTETRSSDSDEAEVVLDVRPIIERGEEPFATIMETVAGLDGRDLLLVAPFEPTPLQGVLSAQGFTYESNQHGDAEWQVRFSRTGQAPRLPARPAAHPTTQPHWRPPRTLAPV